MPYCVIKLCNTDHFYVRSNFEIRAKIDASLLASERSAYVYIRGQFHTQMKKRSHMPPTVTSDKTLI